MRINVREVETIKLIEIWVDLRLNSVNRRQFCCEEKMKNKIGVKSESVYFTTHNDHHFEQWAIAFV